MKTKMKVLLGSSLLALTTMALPSISHAAPIDARLHNETARIDQGADSGSLTPAEAARLRWHKRHIRHQIRRMRMRNGGTLTPWQRARIRREENRLSRHIYRHKHKADMD